MKTGSSSRSVAGFTLIELMVVIVIISIMASLIILNIDGVDQRKAMQARELLILDLRKINREANDQARIYALNVQYATDVASFGYGIDEYLMVSGNRPGQPQPVGQNQWKAVTDFEQRKLPDHVSFSITEQEHQYQNAGNSDLVGGNAPKLIWFGNGEAKPVSIQMYYDQTPVGDVINIDYLGKINEN
ncbi:type II secretion system protein [Acinetobacter sp. WZC-1]|uniref:type II secretion system protein n=1 Tax=Acinetobacter sp. WZC-1 TaxID=3459034 RepID=UPI00403DD83E